MSRSASSWVKVRSQGQAVTRQARLTRTGLLACTRRTARLATHRQASRRHGHVTFGLQGYKAQATTRLCKAIRLQGYGRATGAGGGAGMFDRCWHLLNQMMIGWRIWHLAILRFAASSGATGYKLRHVRSSVRLATRLTRRGLGALVTICMLRLQATVTARLRMQYGARQVTAAGNTTGTV